MDPTTAAGGAAALLLRPAPAEPLPGADREALLALRAALGPGLAELVEAWRQDGPVTGEELLCTADVLGRRARSDRGFAEILASAAADDTALDALADLARSLQVRGQWGAAAWCAERYLELGALLAAPAGVPPALPAPTLAESWPGDLAAFEAPAEPTHRLPADATASRVGPADAPAPDPVSTMVALAEQADAPSCPEAPALPNQRTA